MVPARLLNAEASWRSTGVLPGRFDRSNQTHHYGSIRTGLRLRLHRIRCFTCNYAFFIRESAIRCDDFLSIAVVVCRYWSQNTIRWLTATGYPAVGLLALEFGRGFDIEADDVGFTCEEVGKRLLERIEVGCPSVRLECSFVLVLLDESNHVRIREVRRGSVSEYPVFCL